MPRPKNIEEQRDLHTKLRASVYDRMALWLTSDLEGRIPHGEIKRFIESLITEFFNSRSLDLAPYLPEPVPGIHVVKGNAATIVKLMEILDAAGSAKKS